MSFFTDYIKDAWARSRWTAEYDKEDLQAWNRFLESAEKDRQRE